MKRVKVNIAGTDYIENAIVSLRTHRKIFDGEPSVGNCVSGEMKLIMIAENVVIPRNAKIIPYLKTGDGAWVKKSEYYVYSRKIDKETKTVELTAYDAIFRAEEPFVQPGVIGTYPRTDINVMQEIATRTGTTICADTVAAMNKAYSIPFPGIIIEGTSTTEYRTDGSTTMREVAGRIAAMYAGNWIIDNNGEWRLIILGDIPAETNLLITEDAEYIKMGNDRIKVITGLVEPHRLLVEAGVTLTIGGDKILV